MSDRSTLTEDPPVRPERPEAVIHEARRRRRLRWMVGLLVTIPVLAIMATVGLLVAQSGHGRRPPTPPPRSRRSVPVGQAGDVQPSQPGPVAVNGGGTLFVADEAQNRILARLPDGRFRVVVGSGTKGFSGDGGPAVDAALDGPEGMALGSDGTLYFADFFNNRVRAVAPDGTITTIAGNGAGASVTALPTTGMSAVDAAIAQPTAVAVGPDGSVYVASYTAGILRIDSDGDVTVIEDGAAFDAFDPSLMFQEECSPASLAFDRVGNLYIGCSSPWVLLMRSVDGSLHYLGKVRPHDSWAALASSPQGGVLAVNGTGIEGFGSALPPPHSAFLSYRLPGGSPFWPQGIAAGSDGSLYLTQDGVSGIGPAAIVELSEQGKVSVLWQARPAREPPHRPS